MTLRYGFKRRANELARQVRRELGVEPHGRLNPMEWARWNQIEVWPLHELWNESPELIEPLIWGKEWRSFSGLVLCVYSHRIIVHNSMHSVRRQSATLAHEISHLLLHHQVLPMEGWQVFEANPQQEEEAAWLGPALLISDEAALHIAETGMSEEEAMEEYGVSRELLKMRMQVTAAKRRVQDRREKEGQLFS